jgi:hypothetical protein
MINQYGVLVNKGQVKTKLFRENPATLSTTDPMWPTPELKLGLCGKKLIYNCLMYGVLHKMSKGSGAMVEVKMEY